jgi:hypothetical protein
VPAAHAHAHGDDDPGAGETPPDRPILLVDIDRMLEGSANVDHLGPGAPLRTWRDELTVVLQALRYARTILAGDVAILRHRSAGNAVDEQSLADHVPRILASPRGSHETAGELDDLDDEGELDFDLAIFDRTDQLLSTHHQMARVDLTSQVDVARVLAAVDEQLAGLTTRQEAAEARLHQIRAAIIRQYQEANPPQDKLA